VRFHGPPSAALFEEAPVEQIDSDAGRPEAVAAEPGEEPGPLGAADDHALSRYIGET
jgi:hypothetical protein